MAEGKDDMNDEAAAGGTFFPTPVLANAVERVEGPWSAPRHALPGLTALRREDRGSGPAYTIRLRRAASRSAQNTREVLAAYDAAPPGSFVIVQVVDDVGGAVLGDITAHRLSVIGIAGIAVCGAVRDVAGLEEFGPPLWYAELATTGLEMAETAVETQVELTLGQVIVRPGDLVTGDVDGVLALDPRTMAAVAEAAGAVLDREERWHRGLRAGGSLVEVLLPPGA